MAYRPGGMSSDEEDDGFEFSNSFDSPSQNKTSVIPEMSLNDQLIEAAAFKDMERVKNLIDKGADVNYKKETSWSAILYAAFNGNVELLRFLIEKGANVNSEHQACTPFIAVCKSDSPDEEALIECVDLLLSAGANKDALDGYKVGAASHAVRKGNAKLLMKLISIDCDINKSDNDGWTPIFYAVDDGNAQLVSILKDYGAELYRLDRRSRSLIDIAGAKDFRPVAELLTGNKTYFDEILTFELPVRRESSYQILLTELPNSEERLSGFSMDVFHILRGIGLGHLSKIFYENNVQLGQLLTSDDEKLKKWGVMLSFERKTILSSLKNFHEHPWSTDSFGSTLISQDLDLFQVVKGLSTVMRQLYVLNITVYLMDRRSFNESDGQEVAEMLQSIQTSASRIQSYIEAIRNCGRRLELDFNPHSPDFIGPVKKKRNHWQKYLFFTGTLISLYLLKRHVSS